MLGAVRTDPSERDCRTASPQPERAIEADDELFFIGKLPISAKNGPLFGLASGKIGVRGDILET